MTDQRKKYLYDILRSIELIEIFLSSVNNFDEYAIDPKTQSAKERHLAIIGEAVNKLDNRFPNTTLDSSRQIVGLRNRLIHAYNSVDPSIIWAIVNNHLTPLKNEVMEMINK